MKRRWTIDELNETFTLYPEELSHLTGVASHNQLGFAVLLKCFQHEGCFPENRSEISFEVVEHLAKQLALSPQEFFQYNWDGRTIKQHRVIIREWFGFRPYAQADRQTIIEWLCDVVLPHNQKLDVLRLEVKKQLRANQIELPTPAQIDRLIDSAQNTYETRFFGEVLQNLPKATRKGLDALLKPIEASGEQPEPDPIPSLPLQQIRTLIVTPQLERVVQAAKQLEQLQQLCIPDDLFAKVSIKVIDPFRQRVTVETPSQLRRHPDPIRYTLLAAFCILRQEEITDDLVECLIQIVHKISSKAERRVYKQLLEDLQRVTGKTNLLFRIAEASVDNPLGCVKEVIYPVASEQKLRDLVAEYHSSGPTYRIVIHKIMRRSYSRHYRQMMPHLMRVLDFRTNNTVHQPVINAAKLLLKYIGTKHRSYPSDEVVPIEGVVRKSDAEMIVEYNQKGEMRINRINYEICVLKALRDRLRRKAIWVVGANRYRNPDEDLPGDFEEKRLTYYQALQQPLEAKTKTERLQQEMRQALAMLNENLPQNDKVRLSDKKGGWIHITPLTKQPEPPNLGELKGEITRIWPMTRLLDILKETDLRVNFTHLFTGVGDREVLSRDVLQRRLLLCLYGLGTNMGLTRVSSSTRTSGKREQYNDLRYVYHSMFKFLIMPP